MQLEIKRTGDGSSTLYVPQWNEHYHSLYGAVQESEHVFIKMGLQMLKTRNAGILEIGFGTGLNALLTFIKSRNFNSITYHAIEKYPLKWETVKQLGYEEFLGLLAEDKSKFSEMHLAKWNTNIALSQHFVLRKIDIDITDYYPAINFDLIYFDAFAPSVQPELWKITIFEKLFNALKPEGILVTYCAKGEIRRSMQQAGFTVERLKGAPGKREMLRAIR